MYLSDQRILLHARPAPRRAAALEVVMLGHCGGNADLGQLRPEVIDEIRGLGLDTTANRLLTASAGGDAAPGLAGLYHVPIPLLSLADFQVLFPAAGRSSGRAYTSRLAGGDYWLPQAVEDFFAGPGLPATGVRKLWLIRIPEAEAQSGFLPWKINTLDDPESLTGIACALLIPEAGLVAFPDLERLQIPAALSAQPQLPPVSSTPPPFLPGCGATTADNEPQLAPRQSDPWPLDRLLARMIQPLQQHRPDMQCLWTMPLAYDPGAHRPGISAASLVELETLKASGSIARGLHRVQLLYPYLSKRERRLYSACGKLGGRIATSAARRGAWRSVAGQDLGPDAIPYPPPDQPLATRLRNTPGIGVLLRQNGKLYLDDERLAGRYHPKFGHAQHDDNGQRSGELVRFIGFLQRRLRRLGEKLVFTTDPSDPRPGLLLRHFLGRLHRAGALRGRQPEQAFQVRRVAAPEHVLRYEIEITPALPVDRIRLSFSHRQGANSWSVEP